MFKLFKKQPNKEQLERFEKFLEYACKPKPMLENMVKCHKCGGLFDKDKVKGVIKVNFGVFGYCNHCHPGYDKIDAEGKTYKKIEEHYEEIKKRSDNKQKYGN